MVLFTKNHLSDILLIIVSDNRPFVNVFVKIRL